MIFDSSLIKQTKIFKLSTQSSSGVCLNDDTNYKSSFKYSFPILNFHQEDIEFVYLSVPYVSLPCSFYTIDYQNNRLDVMSNSILQSYIFPSGNYNSNTFIAKFKQLLGVNWYITLDTISNTFTITNSVYSFQILSSSSISYVMGFSNSLASSLVGSVNTVSCPRTCNFLPIPRIHIRCKELASSCLIS